MLYKKEAFKHFGWAVVPAPSLPGQCSLSKAADFCIILFWLFVLLYIFPPISVCQGSSNSQHKPVKSGAFSSLLPTSPGKWIYIRCRQWQTSNPCSQFQLMHLLPALVIWFAALCTCFFPGPPCSLPSHPIALAIVTLSRLRSKSKKISFRSRSSCKLKSRERCSKRVFHTGAKDQVLHSGQCSHLQCL